MKLYLVPTPVGNLGDITFRAIETLRSVDFILCEDTRTSGILLKHFQIENKLMPFHQHNEHKVLESVIERLKSGAEAALISDAGSPGISDPGFLLVRACVENGIEVSALPGATAFVPALTMSGFPTDSFVFEGFLPVKKGRQSKWKQLAEEHRTIVLYESPHRLLRCLEEISEYLGAERIVSVSREISKIYEETQRGTAAELIAHFKEKHAKGEIVIVVKGRDK